MKCPFCGALENRVIDSRLSKDMTMVRRRRECECSRRFTTYEKVEDIPLMIVKKDGRREQFKREKMRSGMQRACQKRNISMNEIDDFIDALERELKDTGEKEIPSNLLGERVMRKLQDWDDVAYVRFASVYREFKDVDDFVSELKSLLKNDELPSNKDKERN